MRTSATIALTVTLSALPAIASAQSPWGIGDEAPNGGNLPAPARAFEMTFSGGYTQPFGSLVEDVRVADIVGPGGAATLDLGYRLNPWWSLSTSWQYHESQSDNANEMDVRGLAAGLQATHRFLPHADAGPYLTFGAGYRVLWMVPPLEQNRTFHGIEAAKLIAGLDLRATPSVSFGPMLGVDLNVLMFEQEGGGSSNLLEDPRPIAFLYAAFGATFDVGGDRVDDDGKPMTFARGW